MNSEQTNDRLNSFGRNRLFESGCRILPVMLLVLGWLTGVAQAQVPANDLFGNPQVITGGSGDVDGTNVNATTEAGEPTTTNGFSGGSSIWFSWLAPASGSFTFSLAADFDSQLAVYTGTAVESLVSIAESEAEGFGGESVTIDAVEGTNYRLRVTGFLSESGNLTLNWIVNPRHTMLTGFTEGIQGIYPSAGLVQGIDGSIYGTTLAGGANGEGTVFRLTPGGEIATLGEFTGTAGDNPGGSPAGDLVQGGDGSFYGTTLLGGANGLGTVFRMTPDGEITTLVEFTGDAGDSPGRQPVGSLVPGDDGNFYGTTSSGGASSRGTVFRLTPGGQLTVMIEFTGIAGGNPGGSPRAGLVLGTDGNFYGTTSRGGAGDDGTVFRLTPGGQLTTLVEFTGAAGNHPGSQPKAVLVQGVDGNFYGTTFGGGANDNGTVFRLTVGGQHTTLVEFTGAAGDNPGSQPEAGLLQGDDGNFYGTTFRGGADDDGTVFRLTPGGQFATLVEFTGIAGDNPGSHALAGLLKGGDGYFYGTTSEGGANGRGTVFRMTPDGQLVLLAEFTGIPSVNTGRLPFAGLLEGDDGNFYGTTLLGGSDSRGTAFRMTPGGQLATLAEFSGAGGDSMGGFPFAGLIQGDDGSFYGTTFGGGTDDDGTVFRLTPDGQVTTLVEFTGTAGSNSGSQPKGDLVQGIDGNFYGTTTKGGANGLGTVFRVTPGGQFATLVEFTGTTGGHPGSQPEAGLMQGVDGNFYGTTFAGGVYGLGTVFRMTPGGALTTLVEFTGSEGGFPFGGLLQGGDGNFYGTASQGGGNGQGTVFRMTPGGQITVLVEFTGTAGDSPGSQPMAGLILGNDGNYYGSTAGGGADGQGTVFRMTPGGRITVLVEFTGNAGDNPGGSPRARLLQGGDGNFYGSTFAGGPNGLGTVFRMAPPGMPDIILLPPEPLTTTRVNCLCRVIPRGSVTTVTLEYGSDGIEFPNSLVIQPGLTGFQSILAGRTLAALDPGTAYYFRFRATNSFGETVSPIQSVSTLSNPLVVALPATNISPTSAVLNGTVNARNFESTVFIEWGTDGNSFPHKVAATPSIVTGNSPVPVNFALGNRQPGQTFFYRIVATNAGGTATSGTQSYRTLIPATARISDATAISTTRAQVTGFVDPKGSSASVSFEYGTDGITFPNSFTASPGSVSGELETEVTATLTGLTQGTTYHFRIRAQGPGGTGLSESSTLSLSILSGLTQAFPDPPPPSDGMVTVNFNPASVGAWRFTGDTKWLNSGVIAGNLATGQRTIEFLPIPGFIRPPAETVDVTSRGNISLDRFYFETPAAGSGALTVRLKPDELAAAEVPEADRTQWRIVGEPLWQDSEDQLTGLAPGSYLVECKPVAGRDTPPTTSVSIGTDDSQDITLTYFTANSTGGLAPLPLDFTSVSTDEDLPFAYVGQIRSEVGSSTGFVVKRRVVATAGHVVFDDGTLSGITGLQWLFQRHTGEHEPRPQIPRGYYLAAGYAAQRILDDSPGEGSAESQNLDYAALYFTEEAGRGGYGGYLATDSGDDNEFLNSTAGKILAGYPVDGIAPADEGKLHATASFTPALTPALGETWTTSEVRGLGGISGGPLFVRFENGSYLPAAIYLGGAGQTVVRAIDADVVELFLRAEVSGNGGENNTGGGITHSSFASIGTPSQPGSLVVTIEPAAARNTGAGWRLKPETSFRPSGNQKSGLVAGTYKLEFITVSGFEAPLEQTVTLNGGQITQITFTYQTVNTPLETWRLENFGTTANTGDAADGEDPDKDGQTNIDEFVAGTDPTDPSDVLRVMMVERVGGGFEVRLAGKTGRSYTLERRLDLGPGDWNVVASEGPNAADGALVLRDESPPSGKGYYQVRVTGP